MELFYGILAAIALSVILILFQKKKRKDAWEGVVIKIKETADYYDDEDNFREGYIKVHYRTDRGKKGSFRLRKGQLGTLYPGLRPGQRLSKQAGKDLPEMVA